MTGPGPGSGPSPKDLFKRGAILLIHKVRFPGKTKAKFCILLEDFASGGADLIVVFVTSRMDFQHEPTAVILPGGVVPDMPEPGVIECNNWMAIRKGLFASGGIKHLGYLPAELMTAVDAAIAHVQWEVDEVVWLRMRG